MTKQVDFDEISLHDSPEKSLGFLLWQISTSWRSSIEATLKDLDLTHPQFVILATLGWLTRNGDPITQSSLGIMANIDPNTVSQIIKGLENKKLIIRKKSDDGRIKNPFLTKKGSLLVEKSLPRVEEKDSLFFNHLSQTDLNHLTRIFQKLIFSF
ncbi:MAG: hypothetical protein S4CHLAM20_00070 [Chlamydiia bacterium]|nr:hypothetical protein [Chlamydiia bacterium]